MPICKNCGVEISDSQYTNFKGMCPDCIRLDRTIDRNKAKAFAGINFGLAFITTIATIFLIVIFSMGDFSFFEGAIFLSLIPLLIAIVNWYFFFVNRKKSKISS